MAEFTVDTGNLGVPSPNVPDQTGASRGQLPNRAFEALFEGIGNVGTNVIKQVDASIQDNIRKEAEAVFANANAPYDASLPAGLRGSTDKVKNLQAAYEQGKLSDVHYYGLLNSEFKRMRSQYPGYEEIVDQTMQDVTGVRPANAYKNAIDAEFQKQESEASSVSKAQESWKSTNQGLIEAFFPGYFANPEKYSNVTFGELQGKVAGYQAAKIVNEDLKTTNKEEAYNKASVSLNLDVNAAIDGLGTSLGLGTNNINDILTNITTASYKPEELLAIGQGLDKTIAGLEVSLRQQASKNRGSAETPTSWESVIGTEGMKSLIDNALEPLKHIRKLVSSGDMSGAASYAWYVKAAQDHNVAEILKLNPSLPIQMALETIDPMLADTFKQQNGGPTSMIGSIIPEVMARMTKGDLAMGDVAKSIANAVDTPEKDRADALNQMLSFGDGISMQAMTPEELKTFVNGTYGDGNSKDVFDLVESNDYMRVFNTIYSTQATEAIKARGDAETIEKYKESAIDNFQRVPEFRNAADAINKSQTFFNFHEVKIDANGHVQIFAKPDAPTSGRGSLEVRAQLRVAQEAVASLNRAFDLLAPIMDEAGGEDMIANRKELLNVLNVDIEKGKTGTFIDRINDAFDQQLLPAEDNGKTDLTTTGQDPVVEQLYKDLSQSDINDVHFDLAEQQIAQTGADDPKAMARATTPIEAAKAYIGMNENNPEQSQAIAAFIQKTAGINIDPSKTAWCAAFLDGILHASGSKGTGKLNARSYLDWGTPVDTPQVGDVVVFKRGNSATQGHVGLISAINPDGTIKVLGGNQGDSVSEKDFPTDNVLGYRRASEKIS